VLSKVQQGQELVLVYFSNILYGTEKKNCITRWELLGIVKPVEHFQKYLYDQQFLLRSDHSVLAWLLSLKKFR
jgi:hypothetical protein